MFKIHVGMIGGWKNGTLNGTSQKDDIEITDIDDLSGRTLVVSFDTAWCPPYSIYKKLRDKFKDVKIEWWARDEDDDTNGEGYYLK